MRVQQREPLGGRVGNIVKFEIQKDFKALLFKRSTTGGPTVVNSSLPTFERQELDSS